MSQQYPNNPPQQQPMPHQGYHYPYGNAPAPQPRKRNWFRRHPVWTTVFAVTGIIIVAAAAGGSGSTEDTHQDSTVVTQPSHDANNHGNDNVKPEPKPEPEFTVSQEQAIQSAQGYLDMSGFSKQGLIDQLSSNYADNFPKADAVFAVRHLDVDWNQEALQAGQQYMDMGGFSKQGLIDQLSSNYADQFTTAQATYAANRLF